MKLDITTLDGAGAGSVDLDETIFGLEPFEADPERSRAAILIGRRKPIKMVAEPP